MTPAYFAMSVKIIPDKTFLGRWIRKPSPITWLVICPKKYFKYDDKHVTISINNIQKNKTLVKNKESFCRNL